MFIEVLYTVAHTKGRICNKPLKPQHWDWCWPSECFLHPYQEAAELQTRVVGTMSRFDPILYEINVSLLKQTSESVYDEIHAVLVPEGDQ